MSNFKRDLKKAKGLSKDIKVLCDKYQLYPIDKNKPPTQVPCSAHNDPQPPPQPPPPPHPLFLAYKEVCKHEQYLQNLVLLNTKMKKQPGPKQKSKYLYFNLLVALELHKSSLARLRKFKKFLEPGNDYEYWLRNDLKVKVDAAEFLIEKRIEPGDFITEWFYPKKQAWEKAYYKKRKLESWEAEELRKSIRAQADEIRKRAMKRLYVTLRKRYK